MNTLEPCCKCRFLYYDALGKDDPGGYTECLKGKTMGNKNCSEFLADKTVVNINLGRVYFTIDEDYDGLWMHVKGLNVDSYKLSGRDPDKACKEGLEALAGKLKRVLNEIEERL